jgi:hypothetical protein
MRASILTTPRSGGHGPGTSVIGAATFRQTVSHESSRELNPNSLLEKGDGATYCCQHIISHYLNGRWGEVSAISIKPTDVQAWLHSLSEEVKAEGWARLAHAGQDPKRHGHGLLTCHAREANSSRDRLSLIFEPSNRGCEAATNKREAARREETAY